MKNRNVFANLMNIGDEKIHRMIGALDTILDVKEMKQEYSELKRYFRAYKRGEFRLESDEDKKEYSEKLSEYLRLQRDIKENEQEEHKKLLAAPYQELIKEHKRLRVFCINSDDIRWAEEKLAASEDARKRYKEAAEEKTKFAEEEKELKELKKELREYKNGERDIEDAQEYGEKLSRYLELSAKSKRINKEIEYAENRISSVSDKDVEKAKQIIKITTDENNWDMLMETSLDSLLNEQTKPEETSKGKKPEDKKPDEKAQENKPKQETGPKIVETQNGQAKPLNPETNAQETKQPQGVQKASKAEKPVFKDEEEHSDLIDPYGEWNWKEYLKNLPSNIINLFKEVRETKRAVKRQRKEEFIKEYREENGKEPSRMTVFVGTHKRISKIAEFFKEVQKASQSLTPEEQEAEKTVMKKGFTFRSSREAEEQYDKEHTPDSFKDRRDAFVNRDDIASDVTPELQEFEDISSNSRGEAEPEASAHTEASQGEVR